MRALSLLICVTLFSSLQAQQTTKKFKGEVKLNALYLVLEFPEVSYEHYLNEASSAGISIGLPITEFDVKFEATPFYRLYFSNRRAQGFLLEANAVGFIEEQLVYNYDPSNPSPISYENSFQFGLGIAIGYKFINNRGWVGEISAGVGRVLTDSDTFYQFYPRGGISVGRAF